MLGALDHGYACCRKIGAVLRQLVAAAGKTKRPFTSPELNKELYAAIEKKVRAELTDALDTKKYGKLESYARIDALHDQAVEDAAEEQKAEAGKRSRGGSGGA